MINQKYNELLQAIAEIIAIKNIEIEKLHKEINRLNILLCEAEKKGN